MAHTERSVTYSDLNRFLQNFYWQKVHSLGYYLKCILGQNFPRCIEKTGEVHADKSHMTIVLLAAEPNATTTTEVFFDFIAK